MAEEKRTGRCLCGSVTVTCIGAPKVCAICHCSSCRHWTGSMMLVNLYEPDKVTVEGELFKFETKEGTGSHRKTCVKCKSPVINDHTHSMKLIDVCGGVFDPPDSHNPGMHLNYGEKIMSFKDGLPKFKDLPEAFGGSNEMLED